MAFSPLSIIGWITGLPLGQISSDIASVAKAKVAAETDKERLDHEERENDLRAKQAVLVAEAGNRINTLIRAAFALPALWFIWQTIVVDKGLCKLIYGSPCRTDDLSANQWYYVMLVLGFYFVHWTVGQFKK